MGDRSTHVVRKEGRASITRANWCAGIAVLAVVLSLSPEASAAIDNAGILTTVTDRFYTVSSTWGRVILGYASNLFWCLAVISLVWTGGMMILRQADLQEFFAEFVRYTLTLGFFYWLLVNGPAIGKSILDALVHIGADAMGAGVTAPSGVLDLGFELAFKTYDAMSLASPIVSLIGVVVALAILIILALIAANLTVQFCAAWVVLYAGCILLGFGGSRWTSDIAIQYYKTVLGIGLSLLTMILLLGVGRSILEQYFTAMSGGIQLKELTVILVVVLILLLLIDRLPGLMAGIVSHGISHAGIGTSGAGTALAVGGLTSAAGAIASQHLRSAGGYAAEWTGASALFERIRGGQGLAASMIGDAFATAGDFTASAVAGDTPASAMTSVSGDAKSPRSPATSPGPGGPTA